MNPKIEKAVRDIERTKNKIADLQAKQRTLEQLKTELENEEIVALFRKERLTEDEFREYIQSRHETEQYAAAPTGAHSDFDDEEGKSEN